MQWRTGLAAAAVTLAVCPLARAHDLVCEETVNGAARVVIDSYPATVTVQVKVTNVHPSAVSIAQSLAMPLLTALGFTFDPPAPFPVGVGQSVTDTFSLDIQDEDDCKRIAALDGYADAVADSQVTVTFDQGSAQCSARIVCLPQTCSVASAASVRP